MQVLNGVARCLAQDMNCILEFVSIFTSLEFATSRQLSFSSVWAWLPIVYYDEDNGGILGVVNYVWIKYLAVRALCFLMLILSWMPLGFGVWLCWRSDNAGRNNAGATLPTFWIHQLESARRP